MAVTAIYSTLIFHGLLPASGAVIYTTPQDQTLVVRDIEVYNGDSSDRSPNYQVDVSGNLAVFWSVQAPSSAWRQWQGRVVIPAGAGLFGFGGGSGLVQTVISGYLLGP